MGAMATGDYVNVAILRKPYNSEDLQLIFTTTNDEHFKKSENGCPMESSVAEEEYWFKLNKGSNAPGWTSYSKKITKVTISPVQPTTTHSWFSGMNRLKEIIGLNNLNTQNVTDMSEMFIGCTSLQKLDVSHFNTEKVTDMSAMFWGCKSLDSLDLSSFSTKQVKKATNMFAYTNLSKIKVGEYFGTGSSMETISIFRDIFDEVGSSTWACYLEISDANTYFQNWKTHYYGAYYWWGGWFSLTPTSDVSIAKLSENTDGKKTLNFVCEKRDLDFRKCDSTNVIFRLDCTPAWTSLVGDSITKVVFDDSFSNARPTSTSKWFAGLHALDTIVGIQNLNTSRVTDMSEMFDHCWALKNLNVSGFNTQNVTDMSYMFEGCSSLKCLDVSKFDTHNVTDMSYMFMGCSSLTSIDISGFKMQNVKIISNMFENCSSLTTLDVSNLSHSVDAWLEHAVFSGCSNLVSLNIGHNDQMFYKDAFQDVGMSNWPCYLIVDSLFQTSVLGEKEALGAYHWCGGWFSLTPKAEVAVARLAKRDDGFKSLTFSCEELDLSIRAEKQNEIFPLNRQNGSTWAQRTPRWVLTTDSIRSVTFEPSFAKVRPLTTQAWFKEMDILDTIVGLQYLNTSEVTSMSSMFFKCINLKSLNLNNFDTSKVTNMSYMFDGCSNLEELYLENFNTANVTDMSYMLYRCSNLKVFNPENFNVSKVYYMTSMFEGCTSLEELNLKIWDTSSVIDMDYMFYKDASLRSLDISNFHTAKTVTVDKFLSGCTNLTKLNVGGDKFSSIRFSNDAFDGVGAANWPCYLVVDSAFQMSVLGDELPDSCYKWSGGWFSLQQEKNIATATVTKNLNGGKSLTFACETKNLTSDKPKDSDGVFLLNDSNSLQCGWFRERDSITTVVFDESFAKVRPLTTQDWFYQMENLDTIIGIQNLNTSETIDMSSMFSGCSMLKCLDVSSFDMTKVRDARSMFANCRQLAALNLGANSLDSISGKSGMFYNVGSRAWPCYLIITQKFNKSVLGKQQPNGFYNWEKGWFSLSQRARVPLVTLSKDADYNTLTFSNTEQDLLVSRPKSSEGIYVLGFEDTSNSYSFFGEGDGPEWIKAGGLDNIKKVVFDSSFSAVRPTSTFRWFDGMSNLSSIDGIEYLNTSEVTDMYKMFHGCTSLTNLGLSHFNTKNVKRMTYMFYWCRNLEYLDVSNFNTANVTNMSYMFNGCERLSNLDISSFNTAKVKYIQNMLSGCSHLTKLNIGNNDLQDISYVEDAFENVGSTNSPCYLVVGNEFDKSVLGNGSSGSNGEYYQWLGGYFTLDAPTRIISPTTGEEVDSWYTLSGIKLVTMPSEPGIYIHNGKKTIVRKNK